MSIVRCYQLNPSEYEHFFSPQLLYLISLFKDNGHSIRLIGGAVRDFLLGVVPHDIDLATTASTDQINELLVGDSNIELVYTRAEQFGTLTLIVGTTIRVGQRMICLSLQSIEFHLENFSSDDIETFDHSSRTRCSC